MTFLDTGLRASELAGIELADLNLKDGFVKVMGKGAKERMVSFGTACRKALLQYRHRFRSEPIHSGVETFFLSIDGYPITSVGLRSLVERLAKSSGVNRLHPHLMRHTYATMFLLNGGDVFLLKQNLGHTTLTMVEHYLHVAAQMAAIRSQGFSPVDHLEVDRGRQFKHTFNAARLEAPNGRIDPNSTKNRA